MLAACSQAEDDARAEAPATTAQAETSAPAVAVASARDGEAPPLSAYVGKHPTEPVQGVTFFQHPDVRAAIDDILALLNGLRGALTDLAERHADTIMPGFTHLQ
ncbi:hypothetical protein LTR94_030842, partial [Friedmanniomyces endolithicus]